MDRSRLAALAGGLTLVCSVSAYASVETASRTVASAESQQARPAAVFSPSATLAESFDGTFPPTGWIVRNQSTTIGTNTNCWNQFTGTTPWAPNSGTGHTGANFNCTTGANTISGWLITSQIIGLQNGDMLSFWTRKAGTDTFPDRMQVLLCLDSTPDSCGAAGSSGTSSTDVGSFTTVVQDINPTLITGVYPTTYTQFNVTLSGLPGGANNGRLAFRYFVTNGGPSGANSDIISLDDVSITPGAPPSADLSITKTDGVTNVTAGGSTTYTITASNAGPNAATGSTVADTFPASLTCTWTCVGAGGGTCTASGSGNINDTTNLPTGGSVTYTASCSISASATGSLSNTATVAAPAGVTDPTPGNNSATDTDTIDASADVSVTKSDNLTYVQVGDAVDYTITVANAGPSTASAGVSDVLPPELTGGSWTCSGSGGATCTASGSGNSLSDTAALPPGGQVVYLYSATVAGEDANGFVVNTAAAEVLAGGIDPTPGNNTSTDTDTVVIFRDGFDDIITPVALLSGVDGKSASAHLQVARAAIDRATFSPMVVAEARSADGKRLFAIQLVRIGGDVHARAVVRDAKGWAERGAWQKVDTARSLISFAWQSASKASAADGHLVLDVGSGSAQIDGRPQVDAIARLNVAGDSAHSAWFNLKK